MTRSPRRGLRPPHRPASLWVVLLGALLLAGCRSAPRNPAALTPAATPIPTAPATSTVPASPTVPPSPTVATVVYIVQAGDTLFDIGQKYGTTVEAILDANPDVTPETLQIGQELQIPQP